MRFGERPAGVQTVHDQHRHTVLEIALARDGNPSGSEQRRADNDARDQLLVFVAVTPR